MFLTGPVERHQKLSLGAQNGDLRAKFRYEIFCRKLVLERHYTSASFIVSDSSRGEGGVYREPATDLSFKNFAKTLSSHVRSFI